MCIVLRATCRTYGAQEGREEGAKPPARPGKSCVRVQWPKRSVRRREFEEIRRLDRKSASSKIASKANFRGAYERENRLFAKQTELVVTIDDFVVKEIFFNQK